MYNTITNIAKKVLGLETLKIQNSDRLDFTDCAVWKIEQALTEAYIAGQKSIIEKK